MNPAEFFRSTAERCYRLAGACTDRRMADALLDYAGECAAKAGCVDRATFAGLLPETPPVGDKEGGEENGGQPPATDAFGGRQSEPRKL
jgi:hypothetical protein